MAKGRLVIGTKGGHGDVTTQLMVIKADGIERTVGQRLAGIVTVRPVVRSHRTRARR